jgi:hypothetical protein
MTRMRKCNDEVYQLAKNQALVKMLKTVKRNIRRFNYNYSYNYSLFVDLQFFLLHFSIFF